MPIIDKHTNTPYYTCGQKLYRPIWLWAEIDMGRNCYGPKCPVTFCCTLLYVHSSIAIILMGKRELIALLNMSSWCLVMVERLFLAVLRGCLQFMIVVFPDHTHLLFWMTTKNRLA